MKQMVIKRGDIFWVDFDPSKATEIQKTRPAVVVSHDLLNENHTRVVVAPITSNLNKVYPFEYALKNHPKVKGKIMLDQMRSIDKSRLGEKICSLPLAEMHEAESVLKFVLGLATN